jgi:glutaredoxin
VTGKARVGLLTRPGCGLCDKASEALRTAEIPFDETDITGDRDLEAEYGDRIPVIMLDGKEHGYWRVEIERLRRDMTK